jgi:hypothetical protein
LSSTITKPNVGPLAVVAAAAKEGRVLANYMLAAAEKLALNPLPTANFHG